jgi:hypothetical protein
MKFPVFSQLAGNWPSETSSLVTASSSSESDANSARSIVIPASLVCGPQEIGGCRRSGHYTRPLISPACARPGCRRNKRPSEPTHPAARLIVAHLDPTLDPSLDPNPTLRAETGRDESSMKAATLCYL